jgi:hypothetical protein
MDWKSLNPLPTWIQERRFENELSNRQAQTKKGNLVAKTRADPMNPA